MPFDVHNTEHVHNHVNMLQINSLYISVKQCGSSWELTTGICKYGLALAFPKVPEQPGCPLTFELWFTGKQRWSSNLHLSWCLTPTLLPRKRRRDCHISLPLAVEERENELKENSWSISSVIISPQSSFCLSVTPLFSPFIGVFTVVFLFFLLISFSDFFFFFCRRLDPAWLQALISGASEPRVYWLGLQSTKQM